jgi:hypothetical protein
VAGDFVGLGPNDGLEGVDPWVASRERPGEEPCETCDDTGLIDCPECGGVPDDCDPRESGCDGDGSLPCPVCNHVAAGDTRG